MLKKLLTRKMPMPTLSMTIYKKRNYKARKELE